MGTYRDFSQLKKIKPTEPESVQAPTPAEPEDRALAGAATSTDYFSSLLGGGKPDRKPAPAQPRRTTIVTPATIARVREEQAEEALAAERADADAREAQLKEELEAERAASASLATDLANARADYDDLLEEKRAAEALAAKRIADLESALDAERAKPRLDDALAAATAKKDEEIAALRAQLDEAQRTSLSSSVLLEKPAGFTEKFVGEIREHVIDALVAANEAAEAAGRDRRARILEAVLGTNPPVGELERRREMVKQIVKEAGATLDDGALAELEKLGFRYVSGNKHHKLEWAGIRFPLTKTPSDHRSCLNSAAEINNRVF